MPRSYVISAVFLRNLKSYFSGILGYLFIIVFVIADTSFTFTEEFFRNNLATLDQLTQWFPYLLLFFVPAITMGAWADERRQGTDELLFTMPATDLEILLGKYLSVLSVYTIALLFTVTKLLVLEQFANPDWRLLLTTYFGYWLSGAALLSAGMFASSLIANTTAAFVLGVVVCAVPVFVDRVPFATPIFETLSLSHHVREFGTGLIPLPGLLYFVSLTLFLLYLNLVVITKRHWSADRRTNMSTQFLVRVLSLAIVLVALNYSARATGEVAGLRVDTTAEGLHTLSDTTAEVVGNLPESAPVTIQAFVSPEVPPDYVDHRRTLLNLLKQYSRRGGNLVEVRTVPTESHTDAADEAERFGIEARRIEYQDATGQRQADVFLGAVVTSARDEVLIPFFEPTDSVEYELTNAIATVTQRNRLNVGILKTDANLMGGQGFPKTAIVEELEQHYDVEEVLPSFEIDVYRDVEFELVTDAESEQGAADDAADEDFADDDAADEDAASEPGADEDTAGEGDEEEPAEPEPPAKPENRSRYLAADPADQLDAGEIPEELRTKLCWRNLRLSDAAEVEVKTPGSEWVITDRNPDREYSVEKSGDTLTVKTYRYDVLIAVMPSTLTGDEMNVFVDYVKTGRPVLIFEDPLPFHLGPYYAFQLSPVRPKPPQQQQSQFGQPPQQQPKAEGGKATSLQKALGIVWQHDQLLWDDFQPHPTYREFFGAQALYASPQSGTATAFSQQSEVTAGLEEMLFLYPGRVNPDADSDLQFTSLVRVGPQSGTMDWYDVVEVEESPFTMPGHPSDRIVGLYPRPLKKLREVTPEGQRVAKFCLAARITSPEDSEEKRNAIFVADVDVLGWIPLEFVPMQRREGELDFQVDNLTFVLNAVDVLGGREDLVELRNRRPRQRILTAIESEIQQYRSEKNEAVREQREQAEKQIAEFEEVLQERSREIGEADDLSAAEQLQQIGMAVASESEKLQRNRERIEQETERKIEELNAAERRKVEALQDRLQFYAIVAPPIPAVILGLIVLILRLMGERSHIDRRRLVSA